MPRRKTKPSKVSTNNEDTESSESSVKSTKEIEPTKSALDLSKEHINTTLDPMDLTKYMYYKRKPHIRVEFDHSSDISPEKKVYLPACLLKSTESIYKHIRLRTSRTYDLGSRGLFTFDYLFLLWPVNFCHFIDGKNFKKMLYYVC